MAFYLLKDRRKVTEAGYLRRFVRKGEPWCSGLEEVYFSQIRSGVQRGWYKNNKSVSILMVISGRVEFLVKDNCKSSEVARVILDEDEDVRIKIEKGCWYAFKGLGESDALICNALQYVFSDADAERASFTDADGLDIMNRGMGER